ncbi:pyruvate dehydrogenase complex dihydrolipoamide acetyltransferase, partial [Cellulomonas sp. APG4]|uniref:2-oxo acid dehydrogenase subunit E2 n=1 Tax=Cellulomonas sp. APG4 TaxID=1538656 RepID=UPI00137A6449
ADGRAPRARFVSPLARRRARGAGVSLDGVVGTGPGGRVVRRDVDRLVAEAPRAAATPAPAPSGVPAPPSVASPSAPATAAGGRVEPHSPMRRAIARRLSESKSTVPHFYLTAECRVDALLELRREINASGSVRVSVNDLVLRAAAVAFREVPEANVLWHEDGLHRFDAVDVAVAVATDCGLVTPVVRGVEDLAVGALSRVVAELAARAREGRLRQAELEGGTLTVSNLGMYGTREFTAILNPPQALILAVGAAVQQPVVDDGALAVGTVMRCTLSVDHRAVDGALAARWLAAFQAAVEHPLTLLV